jgi:hypothetical protein
MTNAIDSPGATIGPNAVLAGAARILHQHWAFINKVRPLERNKWPRGQCNPLERLVSERENKVNSFDLLGRIGRAWENLVIGVAGIVKGWPGFWVGATWVWIACTP